MEMRSKKVFNWSIGVVLITLAIPIIMNEIILLQLQGVEGYLFLRRNVSEIIYFILCILQPIILPIPEVITIGSATVVLGTFKSFVIGTIGSVCGIVIMYNVARYGGEKIVSLIAKEKQLNKYKKYISKYEILITGLLFIIPILPDEIICLGAGVSGINFKKFLVIAVIAKGIMHFTINYGIGILI